MCLNCNKVEEVYDERQEDIVESVSASQQFVPHHRVLYIYGLCKNCTLKK
ncbi:MAG: hypothetical protein LIO65_08710 [Odoribacter sp.]|nr:hypothetical protein [Odoribacter sp.]